METPTDMGTKVPAKAAADPDFRARLLQERHMGQSIDS